MDAADDRAKLCSRIGVRREFSIARTEDYIHPSFGGTRGFPLLFWSTVSSLAEPKTVKYVLANAGQTS